MSKQKKKPAHHNRKGTNSAFRPVEVLQKAGGKVMEMESANMKNLLQVTHTCNRVAGEVVSVCSGNFGSIAESAHKTFRIFQDFGSELVESFNRSFFDLSELSKDAFTCRNMEDMSRLQNKIMHQSLSNYFNTTSKVFDIMCDSCNEAMEPLSKHTIAASERIQQAVAA